MPSGVILRIVLLKGVRDVQDIVSVHRDRVRENEARRRTRSVRPALRPHEARKRGDRTPRRYFADRVVVCIGDVDVSLPVDCDTDRLPEPRLGPHSVRHPRHLARSSEGRDREVLRASVRGSGREDEREHRYPDHACKRHGPGQNVCPR